MPAKSAKQFRFMAAHCYGDAKDGISKKTACEFVHKTPHKKRKSFSQALSHRRTKREER